MHDPCDDPRDEKQQREESDTEDADWAAWCDAVLEDAAAPEEVI